MTLTPDDGKHTERIAAELERRRLINEDRAFGNAVVLHMREVNMIRTTTTVAIDGSTVTLTFETDEASAPKIAALIAERWPHRADVLSKTLFSCPHCGNITEHKHMIDQAHGIAGTYMAGSERFECRTCGHATRAGDADARKFQFRYETPS